MAAQAFVVRQAQRLQADMLAFERYTPFFLNQAIMRFQPSSASGFR